jgi:hypothetical protein
MNLDFQLFTSGQTSMISKLSVDSGKIQIESMIYISMPRYLFHHGLIIITEAEI